MFAVETYQLTKHYQSGKIKALEACSLQVDQGKIFSLLGPNGAGKTTLIKILTGIIHPTNGGAKILGHVFTDFSIHHRMGYLAENHRFPEFLNAQQVLFYYGKMAGVSKSALQEKIPQLLSTVRLQDWGRTKIRKFSKGMMQRLGLAHALINDPDLIFLDEPTDGIDPIGRKEIRDLLKMLREQGKTIFLNSHLLSEVERISDEVAILNKGTLLQKGSVDDFISIKEQFQIKVENGTAPLPQICQELQIPVTHVNDFYTVAVKEMAQLNELIDRLREQKILIQAIIPRKITLEDFFIEVINDNKGGEN
ncbi:ABC transporter ATP-binding protein [candidate division KSB1 bacterium]|nr:ABC transporter ATP-binding protein [candidate division KSB1 bacterium]